MDKPDATPADLIPARDLVVPSIDTADPAAPVGLAAPITPIAPISPVDPVDRIRPRENVAEREMLTEMLDFLRSTVINKIAGLTDEQARSTPIPSTMCPAWLVKHLTGVEWFWFTIDFAGVPMPAGWPMDDQHAPFRLAPEDTLVTLVANYQAQCEQSRQVTASADLDDMATGPDMDFNLRYALTHMIEETARHCGHLDLLREAIDGQTGE